MTPKNSLLICIILAFAGTALAQTPSPAPTKQAELSSWQRYAVKDEGISALFPTEPAATTDYRNLKRNKKLRDRMVGAYADGVVYSIYTYETAEPRQSLEDFSNEQTAGGAWDPASERIVKTAGLTGKSYSSKNPKMPGTAQFFGTKDRLYKITALGASADDPGVKQFFASIRFDTKEGVAVSDGIGAPFSDSSCPEILTGKQVGDKARVVMKPEPAYTEQARQEQTTGTVVLKAALSCSGSVTNISVVSSLPNGLTERAIAASKKIKFLPAVKDGKHASMWVQLEYNFNLY